MTIEEEPDQRSEAHKYWIGTTAVELPEWPSAVDLVNRIFNQEEAPQRLTRSEQNGLNSFKHGYGADPLRNIWKSFKNRGLLSAEWTTLPAFCEGVRAELPPRPCLCWHLRTVGTVTTVAVNGREYEVISDLAGPGNVQWEFVGYTQRKPPLDAERNPPAERTDSSAMTFREKWALNKAQRQPKRPIMPWCECVVDDVPCDCCEWEIDPLPKDCLCSEDFERKCECAVACLQRLRSLVEENFPD